MRKELTTKERNEIIGLAVDYDADKYNDTLEYFYANKMCEGNKADARIAAAVICVSHIENISLLDKFDTKVSDEDVVHRWGRIITLAKYNGTAEPETIGIYICDDEEKAVKKFSVFG